MREHDKVAVWLNVDLIEVDLGYDLIGMKVRKDMLNAATIYFSSSAREGEYLYAEAKELSLTNKTGLYEVKVFERESKRLVALFTGQVYRKEETLIVNFS